MLDTTASLLLIGNIEILEIKGLKRITDVQAKLLSRLGNRLRIN